MHTVARKGTLDQSTHTHTVSPSPTPRLDYTTGDRGGDDGSNLSEEQQIAVAVAVTSIVLVTLLAVLVVAVVKLAQFIRTSQTFK